MTSKEKARKLKRAKVVIRDDGGKRVAGVFPETEAKAIAKGFTKAARQQGKPWRAIAIVVP